MFRWLLGFSPDTIIGGDFNMPVDSRIFKAYWSGYTDGFSAAGRGFGHTKFETVGLVTYGIRIDHVLTASDWQPAECWVGPDIGSDHRPLIVELIRKRRKNLVP